jgi:hypothetical protein
MSVLVLESPSLQGGEDVKENKMPPIDTVKVMFLIL